MKNHKEQSLQNTCSLEHSGLFFLKYICILRPQKNRTPSLLLFKYRVAQGHLTLSA
jgi:hypothetical protein